MTAPTARPADLMRQAAREESIETLRQLGGIAALHGWRQQPTFTYSICWCTNGQHDGNPIIQREPACDENDVKRLALMYPNAHPIAVPQFLAIGSPIEVTA